ncbi:MAG: sensor histidine kinase [Candidatus Fimenecus sp.]
MYSCMNAAVYIAEVLIIYTYISDIFTRKYKTSFTILIGCLLFTVPYVANELWNNGTVNLCLFFVFTVGFLMLTYEIHLSHAFLHGLILSCIMVATELVCFYSISAVFDRGSFYAYRDSTMVYMFDAVTSKILFLLVCKLCSRFKGAEKAPYYKLPLSYFAYVTSSLMLAACLVLINGQYTFQPAFQILLIILAVTLLFSMIFIFISYEKSASKNEELAELRTEAQIQRIDEKYYQILKQQNENLQTFAHDAKHHLATISNLSDDEQIQQYVNTIYQDLEHYNIIGKTQNKALDIILYEYQSLCELKHITFETEIRTANLHFIEPVKLTALLTNLLDNAVEAAEKCKNGKIYLSINHSEHFDVLTCLNSCCMRPECHGTGFKTTKSDKTLHGYGTKSIAKIVKYYHGVMHHQYDEKQREFKMIILFPLEENVQVESK